ncbi:sensor histidine kinase [Streptomyces hypolithicus]
MSTSAPPSAKAAGAGQAPTGPGQAPTGPAGTRSRLLGRLSVQGWIRLVLLSMAFLLVVCALVGAQVLSTAAERNAALSDHIEPGRSATLQLHKALLDQETGVRGFALSGNETFLEPYDQGIRDERRSRATVSQLLDDGDFRADLSAVVRKADEWRREQAEPMIASVRAGENPAKVESKLFANKKSFDELRSLMRAQELRIDEAKAETRAEAESARKLRDWTFAAMLAVFAATGVVLAVLLHRMVVRPLHQLRAASDRVAGGEFDSRIFVHGPSDVQAVGATVEAMRERIAGELAVTRASEAKLAAQAADLDAQAIDLRRSNAELEQFAYVASHDLQEPLRKVASFCQLLEKRYGETVDDRGKQYIAFAVDGAKRMQVLINDLLTFSRVGRVGEVRSEVSLDGVLDRALGNLAASVEDSGATIDVQGRPLPVLRGDPTTLVMLWQNLLGNAIKFRHPDRPCTVTVTCEREGGLWKFCVADNGIGIPEEFSEKVFVIFQRLHGRDEYAGTGIGLALCRKIVEQHGGHIQLDTSVAEGARICFSLPADEDAEPKAAEDEPTAAEGDGTTEGDVTTGTSAERTTEREPAEATPTGAAS